MHRFKIGVFGSAEGDIKQIIPKAKQLGEALGKKRVILLTGASSGLPYEVARTAHENGAEIWGYSQTTSQNLHKQLYVDLDFSFFGKMFYLPKDFDFAKNKFVSQKFRNVTSTANSDAGIIISGRWGTMNEFTNLHDMGKVIGVLTGTGGIADEISYLMTKIHKPGRGSVIIFDDDPERLVNKVLEELKKRS